MGSLKPELPKPEPSSAVSDERALLTAWVGKNRKATAEFVSRYADSVYAYVRSRLAPRFDVVEDVVQEVFLAAWESIEQFHGGGPLEAWLLGIARHKVEDYYRGVLRAPDAMPEPELELAAGPMFPDFDGLLDRKQLQTKTWRVMGDLPEQYRVALIWRYWDKVSAREMAMRLGKTEKAVERLLARARKQFRERWGNA